MTKSSTGIVSFIVGAAIGGVSTWLAVRKYYQVRFEVQCNEVREVYAEKLDELQPEKSTMNGELVGPGEIEVEPEPGMRKPVSSIVRELNNKPDLHDYTSYFHGKGQKLDGLSETLRDAEADAKADAIDPSEALIEADCPPEDEPMTDEEDYAEQVNYENYEFNERHRKAVAENWEPEVIPLDNFMALRENGYENETLNYFVFDDILANEQDEELDQDLFVGDCLIESGFTDNNEDLLYIRNDKLSCVFEIRKVHSQFNNQ